MKPFAMLPFAAALLSCVPSFAQSSDVSMLVQIKSANLSSPKADPSAGKTVVWLTPLGKNAATTPNPKQQYTLTQRDKHFFPRLLVVPTGSSVDFPNLDPFFHNVFSLFNGKRFDLGLYEGHSSRKVQFDREGVSYIFCNIHPEMGAVVISLSTPYYAVSGADGLIQLHNIPYGTYRLNVWTENVAADRLAQVNNIVEVAASSIRLDTITLQTNGDVMSNHPNKFGEAYTASPKDAY